MFSVGQAKLPGGCVHGTVLHALRLVKGRMEVDPDVRQTVQFLEKQLLR